MAARGTLVRLALWGSRSAHDVYAGADRDREARWHDGGRALCTEGLVCRPPDEHAVGSAASCLLQWRGPMDLSHHSLSDRNGRSACRGNRAVAAGFGNLARAASILPRL